MKEQNLTGDNDASHINWSNLLLHLVLTAKHLHD